MRCWRAFIAIAGLGLFGMPAFGADVPNPTQPANFPDPGTVNYIEGTANLDGKALTNNHEGIEELRAGQQLTTGAGKAEILLTPGIFLRVGSNSAVKMISPDLARTQVELERGRRRRRGGPDLSGKHGPDLRQRRAHATDQDRLLRVRRQPLRGKGVRRPGRSGSGRR